MLLNSQQSEYLEFISRSGFVVTVHAHDAEGFPMDLGTYVPVGYVTAIGIQLVLKKTSFRNFCNIIYRLTWTKCRRRIANVLPTLQETNNKTEFEKFLHKLQN